MSINIEAIFIGIITTAIQMFIYYQILTRPILEELKEIKEKLTQLTQKEEKKSKDE